MAESGEGVTTHEGKINIRSMRFSFNAMIYASHNHATHYFENSKIRIKDLPG